MSEPTRTIHPRRHFRLPALLAATGLLVAACGGEPDAEATAITMAPPAAESIVTVRDSAIDATLEAAGIAEPIQTATLSTKLMGSVTSVTVREGERVRAGQVIATIVRRVTGRGTACMMRPIKASALWPSESASYDRTRRWRSTSGTRSATSSESA